MKEIIKKKGGKIKILKEFERFGWGSSGKPNVTFFGTRLGNQMNFIFRRPFPFFLCGEFRVLVYLV